MDKRSSKRCKVARRFSHGTVLTKSVNENKEKLSLILLKILRIYRKAILFLSMSKLAVMNGRCVFILVQVLLDMTMAVMSSFCLVVMVKELKTRWLRTRFRSKTAIEIFLAPNPLPAIWNHICIGLCQEMSKRRARLWWFFQKMWF